MKLRRNFDWQSKLADEIQSSFDKKFKWGEHDCALFACNCILAQTGTDPAAELRGKYSTELGAARIMKKHYGGGMEETAEETAKKHGLIEVDKKFAKRGDIALIETQGQLALGVVDLNGRHILGADAVGVVRLNLSEALKIWSLE